MGYLSVDDLLKVDLPGEDLEVPGKGTIRIRSLSRAEVLRMAEIEGVAEIERYILKCGVVEPALTEELAGQWQAAWGGPLVELVASAIHALSGSTKEAAKAAYKSFRERFEPGVRPLADGEAGVEVG